jgi:hypothetical protein
MYASSSGTRYAIVRVVVHVWILVADSWSIQEVLNDPGFMAAHQKVTRTLPRANIRIANCSRDHFVEWYHRDLTGRLGHPASCSSMSAGDTTIGDVHAIQWHDNFIPLLPASAQLAQPCQGAPMRQVMLLAHSPPTDMEQ